MLEETPKYIRESKPLQCYHAQIVKQVFIKKLRTFFGMNNSDGTYFYNLTRDKSGFDVGTVTINDFEEVTDEQLDELAVYALGMEDYSL